MTTVALCCKLFKSSVEFVAILGRDRIAKLVGGLRQCSEADRGKFLKEALPDLVRYDEGGVIVVDAKTVQEKTDH